ncbi:MAG: DUF2442 domain-containing protein, partial [Longimicrobiales bacterium]
MATKTLSEAEIRAQIPSARARARRDRRQLWWPESVSFNSNDRALEIGLRSQVSIHLCLKLFPELRRATTAQLKQVELAGEALRWDELDVDCYQLANRVAHAWWLANNGIRAAAVSGR